MQSKHYKDLEAEMEEAQARFQQETNQIEAVIILLTQRKVAINEKLSTAKESSYQVKYSLWEIRN